MSQKRVDPQFPTAGADSKIVALGLGNAAAAPDVYCGRCTYRWRAGLRWDWIPKGSRLRCPNCGSRDVKAASDPQPPEAA